MSQRDEDTAIGPTTRVILVASGKGGVGKSSVTANLAAALATRGLTVGVLDADVWGFSIPRMLGVSGRLEGRAEGDRKLMVPDRAQDRRRPAAHRVDGLPGRGRGDRRSCGAGLMLNRGVQHFLQDVVWGDDLDYLLVDMPPGTGDVQMGVAKLVPRAEVIVVTTPAVAAQKVAIRAVSMARKSFLRVAGVIENMSAFTCDHGETYALFGSGGGADPRRRRRRPAARPDPASSRRCRPGGDAGEPEVLGDSPGRRGVPRHRRAPRHRGRAARRAGRLLGPHARRGHGRPRRRRRQGRQRLTTVARPVSASAGRAGPRAARPRRPARSVPAPGTAHDLGLARRGRSPGPAG